MIGAVFVIAVIFVVLMLWSKLHEARYQLMQARIERDAYQRQVLEALVFTGITRSTFDKESDQ